MIEELLAGILLRVNATYGRTFRMKKRERAGKKPTARTQDGMINFDFANVSYQIDPNRRKVYHRWIEVETAKTCLIMGAWSQTRVQEKRAV